MQKVQCKDTSFIWLSMPRTSSASSAPDGSRLLSCPISEWIVVSCGGQTMHHAPQCNLVLLAVRFDALDALQECFVAQCPLPHINT